MTKYGIMVVGNRNYANDHFIGMFCFPDSRGIITTEPIMTDTYEEALAIVATRTIAFPGYIFEPRPITSRICRALIKSHSHKFPI